VRRLGKWLGKYIDDIFGFGGAVCICAGCFVWNLVIGLIVTGIILIGTACLLGTGAERKNG